MSRLQPITTQAGSLSFKTPENAGWRVACMMVMGLLATPPMLAQATEKLWYKTGFKKNELNHWRVETKPDSVNRVFTKRGRLWIDTKAGVTVWLNKTLPAAYRISFLRKVVVKGGANDRLSDMNQFWQASDGLQSLQTPRLGVLESYDSLQLYYAGIGGNYNSTSRFRKYTGNGQRQLLQDYTDSLHLLKPNKKYRITIEFVKGTTSLWVNGQRWFYLEDDAPLPMGYFALRSTWSRQWVRKFRIWQR